MTEVLARGVGPASALRRNSPGSDRLPKPASPARRNSRRLTPARRGEFDRFVGSFDMETIGLWGEPGAGRFLEYSGRATAGQGSFALVLLPALGLAEQVLVVGLLQPADRPR